MTVSDADSFRLEIKAAQEGIIKLIVESPDHVTREEIGEILLTAFKELKSNNELLLRLILFASLETLSDSKEIMSTIKQYLDEYYSF